jgi:hypothetical protein
MGNSKPIQFADSKVVPTKIQTLSDIHKLLADAGADENEIRAISAHLTGDSLLEACVNNGLAKDNEEAPNTVNRSRTRFGTITMSMLRNIVKPITDSLKSETDVQKEAARAAEIEQAQAEWEKSGGRGRKPGEGNRPRWEIALEKAEGEAKRVARELLNIPAQGRLRPELHEPFAIKFKETYTSGLVSLAAKYPENISGDMDKIEKMVNKGIKNLAVSPAAQKVAARQGASDQPSGKNAKSGKPKNAKSKPSKNTEPVEVEVGV